MIRQPIVLIMGHVDHGKSSILERIKGISITGKEAGGITQTIKSYNIPIKGIKDCCGVFAKDLASITIPGLLFLDSPGHFAFNNLRKRGGALADIAILVIDINEGLKPQTIESIEILKETKTPFIVALNKMDIQQGWMSSQDPVIKTLNNLPENVQQKIDGKIYELIAELYNYGFEADRFDRVDDFTKKIGLVPVSAKTGQGVPELLMLVTGLAQRFLEQALKINAQGPAKATVLEVTEERGIGRCLDVIVYDGQLNVGDKIVVGTLGKPVTTKVKALFELENNKLKKINKVTAAYGVKLAAQKLDNVIAGMPLQEVEKNQTKTIAEVQEQIQDITFEIDQQGIVIKADNIGSLEALIGMLKEKNIQIKRASIGTITKKDIAEANSETNPLNKLILGFNVTCKEKNAPVDMITEPVIYALLDKYEVWRQKTEEKLQEKGRKDLKSLCKCRIMPGYVFRQSNPAVMGTQVQVGKLLAGTQLFVASTGEVITAKSIQENGKNTSEAESGKEVAVSYPKVTVGKQLVEGDILLTNLNEEEFLQYKALKRFLKEDEIQLLKEIAQIRRKKNPVWGI